MERDGSPPTQQPPANRPRKSSPTSTTTIHSLTNDVLLKIFLCLPSLATLVRAALACRPWLRAVVSSPAFRRRFRELHPAPLLGLFFLHPSLVRDPVLPASPSFAHVYHRERDLSVAVRGGDFLLACLLQHPCKSRYSWDILDCSGGYVLLYTDDPTMEQAMAVVNPLARQCRFFDCGHVDTFKGCRDTYIVHNAFLLCSEEEPALSRVVLLIYHVDDVDESRMWAHVFSSNTCEWKIFPCEWKNFPWKKMCSYNRSMQSNGFLYRLYKNSNSYYMISLNTETMEFSAEELPQVLKTPHCSFCFGETKNGLRCIVCAIDFTVGVMLRRTDGDGTEKWMLDRTTKLDTQLDGVLREQKSYYDSFHVVAVRDGFVYLATSNKISPSARPAWFLSLCLETMKLEVLFQRCESHSDAVPYFMAWPTCLVVNNGRSAFGDGMK